MKKSQAEKNTEKKNVIYIRIAQKNDEEIKIQEEEVRHYTNSLGVEITDVYVDNGYSGNNFKRPEFIRLMNDVNDNKINSIYVLNISSFGRDFIRTFENIDQLTNKGIAFISLQDHYNNLEECDTTKEILDSIKSLYKKELGEKIRIGKKYSRLQKSKIDNKESVR